MKNSELKKLGEWEWGFIKWFRRTRPTVYTILRHVSASGMYRCISCYVIKDNAPYCIDWLVAKTTDRKRSDKHEGLAIGGCGMDMGFALVYDFSHSIFPDGFKYRKDEHHRNGDSSNKDRDGGYALKHSWL